MSKRVIHESKLDTILTVENALLNADDYYTRTQLWRRLPKKIPYQTYKRILDNLEASGKIDFDKRKIICTGVNNPKLEAMIKTSLKT
jgi:hypothetical protein